MISQFNHYLHAWANEQGTRYQKFILNHTLTLSIYNRYAGLRLLKIAETIFASGDAILKCVNAVNDALEKIVIGPYWNKFKMNGRSPTELNIRAIKDLHSE